MAPKHPMGIRLLFSLLAFLALPAAAQEPAATLFPSDQRLNRAITVERGHIFLGELLEQLSAATGATIVADDAIAPISGYPITVVAREQPVRRVMDAIGALYSAGPDRWQWIEERRDGKATYTLRNSVSPGVLRGERNAVATELILAQREKLAEFARLPAEQRELLARADPELAAVNRNFERNTGYRSFLDLLTADELRRVVSGEQREVVIPANRLTPQQWQHIRSAYARTRLLGREGVLQPEQIEKITVARSDVPGTPMIMVGIGALGRIAVLGGLSAKDGLQRFTERSWLPNSGPPQRPILPTPAGEGAPRLLFDGTLGEMSRSVAELATLNLLVDEPPDNSERHQVALKSPPRSLSEALAPLSRLLVARGFGEDFLLLRPANWNWLNRTQCVPWPVWKELRRTAEANQGYLTPDAWARMAVLSPAQLAHVSSEFPDAGTLQGAPGLMALYRVAAEMTDAELRLLARPGGIGWDNLTLQPRRAAEPAVGGADPRTLRLYREWLPGEEGEPTTLRYFAVVGEAPRWPLTVRLQPRLDPEERRRRQDAIASPMRRPNP